MIHVHAQGSHSPSRAGLGIGVPCCDMDMFDLGGDVDWARSFLQSTESSGSSGGTPPAKRSSCGSSPQCDVVEDSDVAADSVVVAGSIVESVLVQQVWFSFRIVPFLLSSSLNACFATRDLRRSFSVLQRHASTPRAPIDNTSHAATGHLLGLLTSIQALRLTSRQIMLLCWRRRRSSSGARQMHPSPLRQSFLRLVRVCMPCLMSVLPTTTLPFLTMTSGTAAASFVVVVPRQPAVLAPRAVYRIVVSSLSDPNLVTPPAAATSLVTEISSCKVAHV